MFHFFNNIWNFLLLSSFCQMDIHSGYWQYIDITNFRQMHKNNESTNCSWKVSFLIDGVTIFDFLFNSKEYVFMKFYNKVLFFNIFPLSLNLNLVFEYQIKHYIILFIFLIQLWIFCVVLFKFEVETHAYILKM
jgi:hypothetical protein